MLLTYLQPIFLRVCMSLSNAPLGKNTTYPISYDPSLLFRIERQTNRNKINLPKTLPFSGDDIWHAYEFSWLDTRGKPQIAIVKLTIPCTTQWLIESKSMKLYLNSYQFTAFSDSSKVKQQLTHDLSQILETSIVIELIMPSDFDMIQITPTLGVCLDDLAVTIDSYQLNPGYLQTKTNVTEETEETIFSHLLKSNCLVTNQPDWGTVTIHYRGNPICHTGLLKYIISFRNENEFAEQCVERIFNDIQTHCKPNALTVYTQNTRRGGIDINPFRSNFEPTIELGRLARQ